MFDLQQKFQDKGVKTSPRYIAFVRDWTAKLHKAYKNSKNTRCKGNLCSKLEEGGGQK